LPLVGLGVTVAGVVWFTVQRNIAENQQHASGSQRRELDVTDVVKALIMYLQVRASSSVVLLCAVFTHS
jgi:hypothetical protein